MKLSKRNCGMEMKLVPYGAGWTDVYFNIGDVKLFFIITSVWSDQFSKLLEVLYYLHPDQNDPKRNDDVEYWDGVCQDINGKSVVIKIMERCEECPAIIRPIPHRAELHWDEEGSSSHWVFTRDPTEDEDFELQIDICIHRDEEKHYSYKVRYKDFCYAVAKTCTEVIKSYGIYGYHCAHMRLQKRAHCSFEQCARFCGYESNLTMASTVRESSLCLPGVWIALSISFLFERIYLLSTGLLASSRNAYPSIHTPMS